MHTPEKDPLAIIPGKDDILLEDEMDTVGLKGKIRRVETENAIYYLFKNNDELIPRAFQLASQEAIETRVPVYFGYDDPKRKACVIGVSREDAREFGERKLTDVSIKLNGKTISYERFQEEWDRNKYQMILALQNIGKEIDPSLQKIAECKDYTRYYKKTATYRIDGNKLKFEYNQSKNGNGNVRIKLNDKSVFNNEAAKIVGISLGVIDEQRKRIFGLDSNKKTADLIKEYLKKANTITCDVRFDHNGDNMRLHYDPAGSVFEKLMIYEENGKEIKKWTPICMADIQREVEKNPSIFTKNFNDGYETMRSDILKDLSSFTSNTETKENTTPQEQSGKNTPSEQETDAPQETEQENGEKTPEGSSEEKEPGEPEEPSEGNEPETDAPEETAPETDTPKEMEQENGEKTPEEPSEGNEPGEPETDAPEETEQETDTPKEMEQENGEKTPEELSEENTPGEQQTDAPQEIGQIEKAPEEASVEHTMGEPAEQDITPTEELTAEDIPLDETPMESVTLVNISEEKILEKKEAHEHVAEFVSKIDDLLGNNNNDIHMNFNSGKETIDLGDYDERHDGCFQMIATDMYLNNPDEFEQIMSAAYDKAETEKEAHEHITEWVSKIDDLSENSNIHMNFSSGKENIDLGDYDERHSDHFRMIATDMYINNPNEFEDMMRREYDREYDKAEKEIENSTRKDSVHALSKDSVRVTYNYSGRTPLDVAIKNAKDQIASGKRNAVEKETRDAEVCFSH